MTPQEKKRLSLDRDCRNRYGENDKSSRKAIRTRKQWVNRSYRRTINQALSIDSPDEIADNVGKVVRKDWKKWPDEPLGDVLVGRRSWAVRRFIRDASSLDPGFFDSMHAFLEAREVDKGGVLVLIRRLRSAATYWNASSFELDSNDLSLIESFIQHYKVARF